MTTAIVLAAFTASPGKAQVNSSALTLAGVTDCLAEAIATRAVDGDGTAVIFSCTATTARTLYNFLGRKVTVEVVEDRNGKYENRAFGNSICYHQIEDQAGNAADEFRCDLMLAVGEVLGE
jgi:hypothetical protein